MFARPHYIELSHKATGENCFKGKVLHINPAGPYVKVELQSEWGDSLLANISQDRFKELGLTTDMNIFIIPKKMYTFGNEGE